MAKYNISIDTDFKTVAFTKNDEHVKCDMISLGIGFSNKKASGGIAYRMIDAGGAVVNMEHYFDECEDCECSTAFETAAEMKKASDRIKTSNKMIKRMKNIK